MKNTLYLFITPTLLCICILFSSCHSVPESQDFLGTWSSTTYTLDGKKHNYNEREILIFKRDSIVYKKVMVLDSAYNYHKGLWALAVDGNHIILAFKQPGQPGRPSIKKGINWKLIEFSNSRMMIKTLVPQKNQWIQVVFKRDDAHRF